ncbi:poly polymerase [Daldinia childiae]|nr:poly polymerase [Daldinia childiae]KAF3063504.1 poly polymerase [Daldinia childiae]
MPQHRLCSNDDPKLVPAQNQYPVWYFFYGTLADPSVLKRLLNINIDPSYCPASVVGGVLKTWGGKYKALVDAPNNKAVQGQAFLVKDQEQEECLQLYETDKYDVVRCEIQLRGKKVKGLTFRFIGDVDP